MDYKGKMTIPPFLFPFIFSFPLSFFFLSRPLSPHPTHTVGASSPCHRPSPHRILLTPHPPHVGTFSSHLLAGGSSLSHLPSLKAPWRQRLRPSRSSLTVAASVLPVQRSSREAPNARPSGGRRDPTPSLPLCLLLRTGDERRGAARRRTRAGGGGRDPAPSLPLRLLLCAGEERGGAEVGSGQQWRQRSSIFFK